MLPVATPLTGPLSVATTGDFDADSAAGTPAATEHAITAATVLRRIQPVFMIVSSQHRVRSRASSSQPCGGNYADAVERSSGAGEIVSEPILRMLDL